MARGAALVVHGFTGAPTSVAGLAAALEAAGFQVAVPPLPGHGTTPEDLAGRTWEDWEAAVEEAFTELVSDSAVVVAGLSMGAALAAGVAARHPDRVGGLIAVNPFVDPPAASFQTLLAELLAAGEAFLPGIGSDIADPAAREEAYDRLPVAALLSMCRGLDALRPRLPDVRCPVLLFSSRQDHVVPTESGDVLAAEVAGPVERVWLERSFHVATLDVERDELERRAVAFARRMTAS